jgi:dTDP-4-dehydrorhamnose 3,5-epimerase
MRFIPTSIPEVWTIEPQVFGDHRGFFTETYRKSLFAEAGIEANFKQDNHSGSCQGTLRGLHYQIRQTQARLFWVVIGEVFDVVVDIRRSSPTFGQNVHQILSSKNRRQVWVPHGFAHGIYVLSEWAEVLYKASDYYAPEWERTLLWNDPTLAIPWPLIDGQPPILSAKDAHGTELHEAEVFE